MLVTLQLWTSKGCYLGYKDHAKAFLMFISVEGQQAALSHTSCHK